MKAISTKAFSLVELSIVLVILGLLVGGVLSGQSLIRAAELRSITADFNRYIAAINTFKGKYFQLPGDMNNATQFWGAQNAAAGVCSTTVSTTQLTCNGNGDGRIGGYDPSGSYEYQEELRLWQHLANAGLVEGSFPGADAEGDEFITIGRDVPKSRIANAGYSVLSNADYTLDFTYTGGSVLTHSLCFGSITDASGACWGAIKPEEAWNIDTKMDDGKPGTGKILANIQSPSCMTTTVASTSVYAVSTTDLVCGLGLQF